MVGNGRAEVDTKGPGMEQGPLRLLAVAEVVSKIWCWLTSDDCGFCGSVSRLPLAALADDWQQIRKPGAYLEAAPGRFRCRSVSRFPVMACGFNIVGWLVVAEAQKC